MSKLVKSASVALALSLALSAPVFADGGHGDMTKMQDGSMAAPMKGAATASIGALEITNGFTRAMPPAAKAGGGFISITNTGDEDDRLVTASTPSAGVMELHNMTFENNVMVMRQMKDGIAIPAGETVDLKPGGMHLMFMQVPTPFVEGEKVSVTLVFEKAGEVVVDLPVAGIGASGMAY
jgi:copper(I)-binding protein